MRLRSIGVLLASVASLSTVHAAEPARILTNHIGYEAFGPKQAVIQGGGSDRIAEKRTFVTYDDVQSVTQKSRYVRDRGCGRRAGRSPAPLRAQLR